MKPLLRCLLVVSLSLVVSACAGTAADHDAGAEDAGSASTGGGTASTGGGTASTGGGTASTGGGSASTGGGTASTGGGSASTGGGSASTGGGSASTGGGTASTGGGTASTGGGTASTGGGSASTGGGTASTGGGTASTGGGTASTGGGTASTGGGSASTGGGSASTGGGSASTGGGSASTGGGSASTGGGSASTGGGSASTGGGTASTGGGTASTGGGTASTGGGTASTGGGTGFDAGVPAAWLAQAGPQADGGYEAAPINPYAGLDYFVDSVAGSDTNNGRSTAAAFKTLAKVTGLSAGVTLQPGDRVFLKRGSVFRETATITRSGIAGKPITFSAYGSGAAPIISGADAVTSAWTVHSGTIYKTTLATNPGRALLANHVMQTQARFPNKDATSPYLFKDPATPTHANESTGIFNLIDTNIPAAPAGTWAGASITLRTTNWSYAPAKVTAWDSATKKMTLDTTVYGSGLAPNSEWKTYSWGYFLFGQLALIDQPGEWFYDPGTTTLYFQAPGNVSPATVGPIEYPVRDIAFDINYAVKYLDVEQIRFEGTKRGNINLPYTGTNVNIRHCEFSNSFIGIIGYEGTLVNVQHNRFHDLWENAAKIGLMQSLDFSNNVIRDIATLPGMVPSQWTYIALDIGSKAGGSFNVHDNDIERTGYIGITVNNSGLVENNVVRRPLAMLNDGGGLAWDHIPYNGLLTIRKNMVLDCQGNTQSTAPDFHHIDGMCHAFYYGDHGASNTIVEQNTVKNASGGCVLIDSARIPNANNVSVPVMNQVVRNNKFFNCGRAGVILTDQSLGFLNGTLTSCGSRLNSPCFVAQLDKHVTGNEIYLTSATASGLYNHYVYSNGAGAVADMGDSDYNYIFHPTAPNRTFIKRYDNGLNPMWHGMNAYEHDLTLTEWVANMGDDVHSVVTSGAANLAPAATRGRMIYNDTFAPKTFTTANGSLETCLYRLNGTAVGTSITLGINESLIAEKTTGTGCN